MSEGRKERLLLRSRMIQLIRGSFFDQGYLEVETPQLISAPAPEVHIQAIEAGDRCLHTSPELCMKRLLASGFPKIFQIAKCFREGERGDLHLPEFSLLEWYRTGIDYKALMEECEALILFVSLGLGLGPKIHYRGTRIDLQGPWERISVRDAFARYSSTTLETAMERGCFDKTMVEEIEPKLGVTRPTFLFDYPASMAALARLKSDDKALAERFEIYIGGLELANGFSELNEPQEQRERFEKARSRRQSFGKNTYPMPEMFLTSLAHMPEAAGIALGVDRLAMIFTGANQIDQVVSFAPEEV